MDGMPQAELVFEIEAECLPPLEIGTIDGGTARMIPITGGRVSGPRLSGTVMPGADWAIQRGSGVITVDARYALQADDGTTIQIFNGATTRLTGPPRGDGVLMITSARFIAPDGPHDWLNHGVYLGTLKPDPASRGGIVRIGIFRMA